jgi:hypothetical protein
MKVAIINRQLNNEHVGQKVAEWKSALETKGHYVACGATITDLPDPLDHYDIAIAHPTQIDKVTICQEVRARSDFRWIINSGTPEDYGCPTVRAKHQVYACEQMNGQKVVKLVEKGWAK